LSLAASPGETSGIGTLRMPGSRAVAQPFRRRVLPDGPLGSPQRHSNAPSGGHRWRRGRGKIRRQGRRGWQHGRGRRRRRGHRGARGRRGLRSGRAGASCRGRGGGGNQWRCQRFLVPSLGEVGRDGDRADQQRSHDDRSEPPTREEAPRSSYDGGRARCGATRGSGGGHGRRSRANPFGPAPAIPPPQAPIRRRVGVPALSGHEHKSSTAASPARRTQRDARLREPPGGMMDCPGDVITRAFRRR
jgi:hypothetical protein